MTPAEASTGSPSPVVGNGKAESEEGSATPSLLQKIHNVYKAIDAVKMTGKAVYGKYADENDIYNALRPHFDKQGILVFPSLVSKSTDGRTDSLIFEFEFTDIETGESIVKQWSGAGEHKTNGDGERGAATYAIRTFLAKTFHIVTEEDPGAGQQQTSAATPTPAQASGGPGSTGAKATEKQVKLMAFKSNALSKDDVLVLCRNVAGCERLEDVPKAKVNDMLAAFQQPVPTGGSDVPVPDEVVERVRSEMGGEDLPREGS